MSPHYLVKRANVALFAVYNRYYYNINVLLPEININITSTNCLSFLDVQLTEVIIVFPNNKWVALTRAD